MKWEERFPRLWAAGEQLTVLVVSGFCFWLFAAPVVTMPAALVGLFAAVGALVRPPGTGETMVRFWRGFRRSFGTALLLGLVDLVFFAVVYLDMRFFWSMGTLTGKIMAFAFGAAAMLGALVNVFAWPLLAWFPQSVGKLLSRAFLLAAAHPFHALGGLVGAVAVPALLWLLPGSLKGLAVVLGPGGVGLATGMAAWQAMKRYAGPDDEFAN